MVTAWQFASCRRMEKPTDSPVLAIEESVLSQGEAQRCQAASGAQSSASKRGSGGHRVSSCVRWVALAGCLIVLTGCGSSSSRAPTRPSRSSPAPTTRASNISSPSPSALQRRLRLSAILPAARRQGLFGWAPAVAVRGQTAVWISRVKAHDENGFTITLLRLDQRLVTLALHAGGVEPGGAGWPYGDAIGRGERHLVVAAFNSAFREHYGAGGFWEGGRAGWPLRRGAASVVIYRDGSADIGAWESGIPAPGRPVTAVRQNLGLLIDEHQVPRSVDTCIKKCWGDPLGEQPIVARSGLGITANGQLVWAAGHNLSVRALADALVAHGALRAMELDINPRWVAGYVYTHPRHGAPRPVPLVPGQTGIPGEFLQPYFRDFFTVLARRQP